MCESQEKPFQTLKHLLCAASVSVYPVPSEKFILKSDASRYGIGGVLSQVVNGIRKVVGSDALNDFQQNIL